MRATRRNHEREEKQPWNVSTVSEICATPATSIFYAFYQSCKISWQRYTTGYKMWALWILFRTVHNLIDKYSPPETPEFLFWRRWSECQVTLKTSSLKRLWTTGYSSPSKWESLRLWYCKQEVLDKTRQFMLDGKQRKVIFAKCVWAICYIDVLAYFIVFYGYCTGLMVILF